MTNNDDAGATNERKLFGRWLSVLGVAVAVYLVAAYLVVPRIWRRAVEHHHDLSGGPRVTQTANGIHGDPVNLALIGSESELVRAMIAAKWYAADPITLRSSLRIAVSF